MSEDWRSRLDGALTKIDDIGVLDDKPMLQGDTTVLLRSMIELDLHDQGTEKLRRVKETIEELIETVRESSQRSDAARQAAQTACDDLEHVQSVIQDALQAEYAAEKLGEITAETTVTPQNKEVTVRSRFKPHAVYKRLPVDSDLKDRIADHDFAKHVAKQVRDTTVEALKEHEFLIKPNNATVEVLFTVKDHAKASILDGDERFIQVTVAVTEDMLGSEPVLDGVAKELLIHELAHAFDDAQLRDKDGIDYELLIIQLRREGIATFAQEALNQDLYRPEMRATEEALQEEREPLPDDLIASHDNDEVNTSSTVLNYAESRHPYDAGKAMIDLMYAKLLDKGVEDSVEQRKQFLHKLRHYDEDQFMEAYRDARDYFDLRGDAFLDAYQIYKIQG